MINSTIRKSIGLFQTTNRTGFESLLAPHFLPGEIKLIMRAYRLSKYGHRNQMREGGVRYFEHPKAVALLLLRLGVKDFNVICAALLHDVMEDSFILTFEDIEDWFGARVCHLVKMVTKLDGLSAREYFSCLEKAEPGAWLVKSGDRLHNLSTLVDGDDPAQRERFRRKKLKQVKETERYILPLAEALSSHPGFNRLGSWFSSALLAWCRLRRNEAM